MTNFGSLLEILAKNGVEFILIGGVAATAHGSVRLTRDLDVVYRRTSESIGRLVKSLAPLRPSLRGAPVGLPFRFDQKTVESGLNFTLQTDLGALDLFGEITGGGRYEDLQSHTIQIQIFGVNCRCLKLRRLIEVKRAVGRPRDLEAIAELEVLLEESQRKNPRDN